MFRFFLTAALLLTSISVLATDLIQHTVQSNGHPMALWEKSVSNPKGHILLLHGRTWSALPDFDLQVEGESLSLMDGFNELGYSTWALDARGYGQTPRDSSGWNTPDKAAEDVANILAWLTERTGNTTNLFGWSLGSMVAQLTSQNHPALINCVILYGYPIDPKVVIEETIGPTEPAREQNTARNAASDFITRGSISEHAIQTYVEVSLKADPVRADWTSRHQWNQLDAAQINIPTLLLQGELDPLTNSASDARFFVSLPNAHKQWVLLKGGDHAALLETPRVRLLEATVNFIEWIDK